jgi:hypothetical protein
MNKNTVTIMAALAFCTAASIRAESFLSDRFVYAPGTAVFGPREFTFDLLGSYVTRDKGGADRDAWGIGAGVNYFLTENIGAGIDTYADAFESPYLLNFSGIYRYPIAELGLAPYGFAGVGRQWEHAPQWTGHIGAGVEFRFNSHTGIFIDGRRVFAGNTSDYGAWRFGLRFGF